MNLQNIICSSDPLCKAVDSKCRILEIPAWIVTLCPRKCHCSVNKFPNRRCVPQIRATFFLLSYRPSRKWLRVELKWCKTLPIEMQRSSSPQKWQLICSGIEILKLWCDRKWQFLLSFFSPSSSRLPRKVRDPSFQEELTTTTTYVKTNNAATARSLHKIPILTSYWHKVGRHQGPPFETTNLFRNNLLQHVFHRGKGE